jgi:hypothetical protein
LAPFIVMTWTTMRPMNSPAWKRWKIADQAAPGPSSSWMVKMGSGAETRKTWRRNRDGGAAAGRFCLIVRPAAGFGRGFFLGRPGEKVAGRGRPDADGRPVADADGPRLGAGSRAERDLAGVQQRRAALEHVFVRRRHGPRPTRDVAALPAPGIALMAMRDVAFLGLAPMRIPPVPGEDREWWPC